jgi:hypothetical protein
VARGVAALRLPVPPEDRFERTDGEAELEVAWVDLDEAVAMIFAARSPTAAVGGCSPPPMPGTRVGRRCGRSTEPLARRQSPVR